MPPARKRVIHIITGLGDGGAEAALYRLCKASPDIEHHVVSLMTSGKYGPLLQEAGIPVTCLNMPRGTVRVTGLAHLRRLVRNLRPDAVQTWMYHADLLGGLAARLAGCRAIFWGIHNSVLVRGESSSGTIWVSRLCALLSRFVPKAIICCARKSADVHGELGYDRSIMRVVPNGYDLDQFRPDASAGHAIRRELDLGNERLIGFVARYDTQKDHETLFQALAILRDRGRYPTCLLVGTGMDDSNLAVTAKLRDLGLTDQVRLLGRRSDIPAIMNALDLHILSSSAEAFPNVLAEAMACGTPCVSTDVGDAAEIVGESGWIVPPGNPPSLAEAIGDALDTAGESGWAARREAARRRIEDRFSIDRMAREYRKIWFA